MNEEFAIEPTTFETYQDVREVLSKFGFHEARFIAALPSKWSRCVYDQISKMPDGVSKRAAIETLIRMKERGGIVKSGIGFDSAKPWVENAISNEDRFEGILVSRKTGYDQSVRKCKTQDTLEETFFGSTREAKVQATVENYGSIATKLIACSHEIILVDPYLFTKSHIQPSSVDVLAEFVRIGNRYKCKSFVVFTEIKVSELILKKHFQGSGANFRVIQIEQGNADNDKHPRYLLSKVGGIRFDKGFEPGYTRRDVAAIDVGMHETLCRLYLDGEHGFPILNETIFQG